MKKTSNPNTGRHGTGARIAKGGTAPPVRTGSASGYFVGTGVNRKTAARPEMRPSRSSPSTNYTRQVQQFVKQSPEPFRNPARAANPLGGVPSDRRAGVTNPRGGRVMSQGEMNQATGHASNYRPKGYHAATSGFAAREVRGARQVGNAHDAMGSGFKSNPPTRGAKLMGGFSIEGGFNDRGLIQGPGHPVRLLPSRTPKGPLPQG